MNNSLPKQGALRHLISSIVIDSDNNIRDCIEKVLQQKGYDLDIKPRFDLQKNQYAVPIEINVYEVS